MSLETSKKHEKWRKIIQSMQLVYTLSEKNPCIHLLEHTWTKSCPLTGDRQTDR